MGKMLWGCAAALAALGAGYLAWDYACDHPESWLGRGACNAEKVAATQVKTIEASQRTAELAFQGMQGLFGQRTGAPCPDDGQCPAAQAQPALDECPPPAVLPGAVVMDEDEDVLPEKPMPPVVELSSGQEFEEATMPAVPEDAAKMPRCDEDRCRPQPGKDGGTTAVMPGCRDEDSGSPHFAPHPIEGRQFQPGSEESEPVFPKMDWDGGEQPLHPDVDTMEVRPGDLWFLDFTGPF